MGYLCVLLLVIFFDVISGFKLIYVIYPLMYWIYDACTHIFFYECLC